MERSCSTKEKAWLRDTNGINNFTEKDGNQEFTKNIKIDESIPIFKYILIKKFDSIASNIVKYMFMRFI